MHLHIRHPGTGHVRTTGNQGRITVRVAHMVGILDRTIISPALIVVAGTQLSLFTSQPCVFLFFFWRGGGGRGGICFRQSLPMMPRSHVLHPVMKLDAFLI